MLINYTCGLQTKTPCMRVVAYLYLSAPGETLDVEPAKFGESLTG